MKEETRQLLEGYQTQGITHARYITLFKNVSAEDYDKLFNAIDITPAFLMALERIQESPFLSEPQQHAFKAGVKKHRITFSYTELLTPLALMPQWFGKTIGALTLDQQRLIIIALTQTKKFWVDDTSEKREKTISRLVNAVGIEELLSIEYYEGSEQKSFIYKLSEIGDATNILKLLAGLSPDKKQKEICDKKSTCGKSAIQIAATNNHTQTVDTLLSQLSTNMTEARMLIARESLLAIVIEKNCIATFAVLERHLAITRGEAYLFLTTNNYQKQSLLFLCVIYNSSELLKRLLNYLSIEEQEEALAEKNRSEESLLQVAAKNGVHDMVSSILEKLRLSAEILFEQNLRTGRDGLSLAHLAAYAPQGAAETVKLMLERLPQEARPDAVLEKNFKDESLLDIAANKNIFIFTALIDLFTEPLLFKLLRNMSLQENTRNACLRAIEQQQPKRKIKFIQSIFQNYLAPEELTFFRLSRNHDGEATKIIAALETYITREPTEDERCQRALNQFLQASGSPTKSSPEAERSPEAKKFFDKASSSFDASIQAARRQRQLTRPRDENKELLELIKSQITSSAPNTSGAFYQCCKLTLSVLQRPPTDIEDLFNPTARKLAF